MERLAAAVEAALAVVSVSKPDSAVARASAASVSSSGVGCKRLRASAAVQNGDSTSSNVRVTRDAHQVLCGWSEFDGAPCGDGSSGADGGEGGRLDVVVVDAAAATHNSVVSLRARCTGCRLEAHEFYFLYVWGASWELFVRQWEGGAYRRLGDRAIGALIPTAVPVNVYASLETLVVSCTLNSGEIVALALLHRDPILYMPPFRRHAVRCVAFGASHVLVNTHGGSVFAAGSSRYGALGIGVADEVSANSADCPKVNSRGVLVEISMLKGVVSVACGSVHSVVVTDRGAVYTFGCGLRSQLGHGDNNDRHVPTALSMDCFCEDHDASGVVTWHHRLPVAVAAGRWHTAVRCSSGDVYTFGAGEHGQLGHGDGTARSTPALLISIGLISHIACGDRHTVLATDHVVYITGCSAWTDQSEEDPCATLSAIEESGARRVSAPALWRQFYQPRTVRCVDACGAHTVVVTEVL